MTILKGIPACLSAELLGVLAEMGHGDRLVLGDANFPASSTAKSTVHGRVIDVSGMDASELLTAIVQLLPMDVYGEHSAYVMQRTERDANLPVPVWARFQTILDAAENRSVSIGKLDRFEFYKIARESYAVVATGETQLYGNIILVKGVIAPAVAIYTA